MYNTRLSRLIMDAIARAGGEYREGICNLATEVESSQCVIRPILRRLADEGHVEIIPTNPRGGRGNRTVVKAITHE